MTHLYTVTLGVLIAAGLLTLVRLVRGPRALDRIMALDVVVTMVIAGTAVGMTMRDDSTALPVLVVLALLAFIGSVTAAHLVEKRKGMR
ncbi:monovalent cation/H+ antiporter complex subunit F [Streptomyces griseomycini]|uniref:Multicomponent Na+:H+ antiporter subunit F n=1 Tax=Streptomyces griseomycini TaxID=66895 RepID=A0A7W7V948_9ACTN|nr:monovalent cation/H+ antiporter complex subunit F [Streptomyces griseomycini]MBB4901482.1 multicomponent Na+:H+ antiporter subunit F [Streptomyces griseomycini]GGQ15016.1 cation:proton antiporter [Streptomyces griseomycini]GGR25106.1 cation:proton antiporter [Streptomyces griseomycini]